MKYREFKRIVGKGDAENYFMDKYFFRVISIPGSYLLSFLRVPPNAVTLASLLLSLSAVFFFVWNTPTSLIVGSVLVLTYHYLDHVDGELARFYFVTQGRSAGIAGGYFDVLVHSFTVNLWLPALGFGVYRQTGSLWVMSLSILAMAALSSFPQLAGTHMYTMRLVQHPELPETPAGRQALEVLGGRHRQLDAMRAGVFSRAGLQKLVKEFVGYPGMILLIVVCVVIDASTGSYWARLSAIAVLTVVHGANSVRRARQIMDRFSEIT